MTDFMVMTGTPTKLSSQFSSWALGVNVSIITTLLQPYSNKYAMRITCRLFFLILVIEGSTLQQNGKITSTDVISNVFCDKQISTEEKTGIKTLEQVHTYAKLKSDPHASLPDSFTVCSTLLTESCKSYAWTLFFTILDNQGAQLMSA